MKNRKADVTLAIQVKAYDIDVAGIVHNSVYLCWLDDVRCAFLSKVESIEDGYKLGYIAVLAKSEIKYKRPIKFGDKVVAELWLTAAGRVKWGIHCDFRVGDTIVAQAVQEGCMVDLKAHRPIELPATFKRYWQNHHAGEPKTPSTADAELLEDFSFEPVVCPV
jgi:acyl-CoA thioester hydrolase